MATITRSPSQSMLSGLRESLGQRSCLLWIGAIAVFLLAILLVVWNLLKNRSTANIFHLASSQTSASPVVPSYEAPPLEPRFRSDVPPGFQQMPGLNLVTPPFLAPFAGSPAPTPPPTPIPSTSSQTTPPTSNQQPLTIHIIHLTQ